MYSLLHNVRCVHALFRATNASERIDFSIANGVRNHRAIIIYHPGNNSDRRIYNTLAHTMIEPNEIQLLASNL